MSPTHAPSPCVEVGCFALATHKGRCAPCQLIRGGARGPYDQARGSARERGYDRKWERRRRQHLEAEPFCRVCTKPGNQVDHVIPHRGAEWLFDLKGNLQTLCKGDHTKKTGAERTMAIDAMYPLDLPEPPHYRPTRVVCGPSLAELTIEGDHVVIPTSSHLGLRHKLLCAHLLQDTSVLLVLSVPAPRTAERAFWSHVMDCEAELIVPPIEFAVQGQPEAWWDDFMMDGRAEEAMARRLS